jgi:hypothetical protein
MNQGDRVWIITGFPLVGGCWSGCWRLSKFTLTWVGVEAVEAVEFCNDVVIAFPKNRVFYHKADALAFLRASARKQYVAARKQYVAAYQEFLEEIDSWELKYGREINRNDHSTRCDSSH